MSGRNVSGRSSRGRGDRNGMRGGEGTRSQVATRAQKIVPHVNLILLRLDGSNILAWRQSLSTHLQSNYGLLGGFIENDALYVRAIPTAGRLTLHIPGMSQQLLLDYLKLPPLKT